MNKYSAKNLQVNGTFVTLDVDGLGTLTVDFSHWDGLVTRIGGKNKIAEVKLLGDDILEFPNSIHVEMEDFIDLAKNQQIAKMPTSANFVQQVKNKYNV